MTGRRVAMWAVNGLLVLAIAGIIGATWWPAVYVSPWFQSNRWVRTHLLGDPPPPPAGAPTARK